MFNEATFRNILLLPSANVNDYATRIYRKDADLFSTVSVPVRIFSRNMRDNHLCCPIKEVVFLIIILQQSIMS